MIHVKIYGVPADISQEDLEEMKKSLKFEIAIAIKSKIKENRILISFINDKLESRSETVIIAEVDILSNEFGTSRAIRDDLAFAIKESLSLQFHKASRVACVVKPFKKEMSVSIISK